MGANALEPTGPTHPLAQPDTSADLLAERHLVRRMIIGLMIFMPIGAVFFALLVGLAVRNTGTAVVPAMLMGAGAGVLAGIFFGTWVGFVASVNEFEELEHR